MRITLAASALMLALAAPAHGADKESWGFVESGKEAFLVYGVPEFDSLTISFICDVEAKRIEIITTVLPRSRGRGSRSQPRSATVRRRPPMAERSV